MGICPCLAANVQNCSRERSRGLTRWPTIGVEAMFPDALAKTAVSKTRVALASAAGLGDRERWAFGEARVAREVVGCPIHSAEPGGLAVDYDP
jgi:hypothetical protein